MRQQQRRRQEQQQRQHLFRRRLWCPPSNWALPRTRSAVICIKQLIEIHFVFYNYIFLYFIPHQAGCFSIFCFLAHTIAISLSLYIYVWVCQKLCKFKTCEITQLQLKVTSQYLSSKQITIHLNKQTLPPTLSSYFLHIYFMKQLNKTLNTALKSRWFLLFFIIFSSFSLFSFFFSCSLILKFLFLITYLFSVGQPQFYFSAETLTTT